MIEEVAGLTISCWANRFFSGIDAIPMLGIQRQLQSVPNHLLTPLNQTLEHLAPGSFVNIDP